MVHRFLFYIRCDFVFLYSPSHDTLSPYFPVLPICHIYFLSDLSDSNLFLYFRRMDGWKYAFCFVDENTKIFDVLEWLILFLEVDGDSSQLMCLSSC